MRLDYFAGLRQRIQLADRPEPKNPHIFPDTVIMIAASIHTSRPCPKSQTPGVYCHPPYSNGGAYYVPNTAGYPPSAPPPAAQGQGQKRTICGLKPVVFWVFVVILSAMVIGGAVGGGVGGTIAARNNSNNDNTAQSDTTTSAKHLVHSASL